MHLPTLILLFLTGAAAAQESPATPTFELGARTWVVTDQPGDGNVWARGRDYKARFGVDATELLPVLGRRSAQNQALLLGAPELYVGGQAVALRAPAAPQLGAPTPAEGPIQHQTVRYDRGALVERWDLAAGGLEHSFVLERPLGEGEILLRVPVRGELGYAGRNPEPGAGLRFEAALDGGAPAGLSYSDARTFDAAGNALEHEVERVVDADGSNWLELAVPAEFAAHARYPLTIDPVVLIFGVDQASTVDARHPGVSFDASSNTWLIAWSEDVSLFDTDVFARRFTLAGTLLEEVAVAADFAPADAPAVANSNAANQHLVVWLEHGTLVDNIRGRTRNAASTAQGNPFAILSNVDLGAPVVGGNPSTAVSGYLVGCTLQLTGFGSIIVLRPVSSSGTPGPQQNLTPSSLLGGAFDVAITKSAGSGQRYGLAWTQHDCSPVVCAPHLRAAVVDLDGVQIGSTIENGFPSETGTPAIAGDGDQFLVLGVRKFANNGADLMAGLIRMQSGVPQLVSTLPSLASDEAPAFATRDQIGVQVTAIGSRYVYAYRESKTVGGSTFNTHVATVIVKDLLGTMTYLEPHVLVQGSNFDYSQLSIASAFDGGGAVGPVCGAWLRDDGSDQDVDAFLYDALKPGGVSTIATGCGGLFVGEPTLSVPAPAIGTSIAVSLSGTGSPLILLGSPSAPVPVCSAGCSLGVFPILSQFATANVNLEIPADTALLGLQVALQGVRLNPTGLGASCGAPQYPISFRTSDTKVLTFQ